MSERCSQQVSSPGMWSRTHQCTRKASVERDGKHYCKTHDPILKKEKQDKSSAKWVEEMEQKRKGWQRAAAMQSAVDGLTTAQLETLGTGGVARLIRDRDAMLAALQYSRASIIGMDDNRLANQTKAVCITKTVAKIDEAIAQTEATK